MECDGRGCVAWRVTRARTAKACGPDALVVSFQEVVHSALTEEAEVAEASDSEGRTVANHPQIAVLKFLRIG